MQNRPEAILEIPKMPNNCYQCVVMKNGISGQECRNITHRSPDLDSSTRPPWCPLKYTDARNEKLLLAAFDSDSGLEPCQDFSNYKQIIINWPDTMDRPYLVQKAIKDIHNQNPDTEIILYAEAYPNLTEFLDSIAGLTFCIRNEQSYRDFLRLDNFFKQNGYPANLTLRVKQYDSFEVDSWHWNIQPSTSILDALPAANTDIKYFVPTKNDT